MGLGCRLGGHKAGRHKARLSQRWVCCLSTTNLSTPTFVSSGVCLFRLIYVRLSLLPPSAMFVAPSSIRIRIRIRMVEKTPAAPTWWCERGAIVGTASAVRYVIRWRPLTCSSRRCLLPRWCRVRPVGSIPRWPCRRRRWCC